MPAYCIVGVFCEDIRQEVSGQETVVGIFPENIATDNLPLIFPKLGLYVRINLSPDILEDHIELTLEDEGGQRILENTVDPALVRRVKAEALEKNSPVAGLISRMMATSFQVNNYGRYRAFARVGGDNFVIGSFNVRRDEVTETT